MRPVDGGGLGFSSSRSVPSSLSGMAATSDAGGRLCLFPPVEPGPPIPGQPTAEGERPGSRAIAFAQPGQVRVLRRASES